MIDVKNEAIEILAKYSRHNWEHYSGAQDVQLWKLNDETKKTIRRAIDSFVSYFLFDLCQNDIFFYSMNEDFGAILNRLAKSETDIELLKEKNKKLRAEVKSLKG